MSWTMIFLLFSVFFLSYHVGELQKQIKALNEKLDSLMGAKNG